MLFNSLVFLLYFLPVVYVVFWALPSARARYAWLTASSYVFYGAWNWKFCFLMLFSTLVSFSAGRLMARWDGNPVRRRWCLVVPITIDLALLGFFKYTNFLLASMTTGMSWFGVTWQATPFDIILPIGISFYTFHTISYIVDCYRRTITPSGSLLEFSCYVSLFSQLVAGPIVRFKEIEGDLDRIGKARRGVWDNQGWSFFAIGMAQKVLLADPIAAVIDPGLATYQQLSSVGAWMCMLGYTYQLYFDFAGYSNMAVGLGYLFGLRIPQNFRSPYKAHSIADFWRRWHISLSSCLRDYLYFPLGGSRGPAYLAYRNLMITMLLGGLWHGASWNFVVWGGYHGVLLCLNRRFEAFWDTLPRLVSCAVTFLAVVVGWVFFRATNMTMALDLLGKMFGFAGSQPVGYWSTLLVLIVLAAIVAHAAKNTFEMEHEWRPWQSVALAGLFAACVVRIYSGAPAPFLYFQF